MRGLEMLVGLPLLESQECRALIVGRAEHKFAGRDVIQLCLHFSRDMRLPFLAEIYNTVTQSAPDAFFGLYIVGLYDTVTEQYHLDDDNPAQWLEAVFVTKKAVTTLIGEQPGITLQVYCAGPNALTFGIGMKLFRFFRMKIFNYIPRQSQPPHYKLVLDSETLLD
jgi:hypothetical protein